MGKVLLCFKREGCYNCPAVEAIVRELLNDNTCSFSAEFINADDISNDLQFRLLENSLFVFSVPTLILDEDGKMILISSGDVPSIERVRKAVC